MKQEKLNEFHKYSRLWKYLVFGIIVIYAITSICIYGKLALEVPQFNTNINLTKDNLYKGLKDFEQNGSTITSISSDPWVNVNLEKEIPIKSLKIIVANLSLEQTNCRIYYASEGKDFSGDKYVDFIMKKGENIFKFPEGLRTTNLRLDLTDSQGVSINITSVEIEVDQDKPILFWCIFLGITVLYCGIIIWAYFHNEEKICPNSNYKMLKNTLFFNDIKSLKLFIISATITFLCYLPYIINTLYAIDDYFLNQIYNINIREMGYNFYSTGRWVEAVLSQIFYNMNIQPLTKPLGPILFILSLCFLGVHITRNLKIRSFWASLCFILLFTTNPFFAEIFHYSIVPIYSAFAILTLCIGFVIGEIYAKECKIYLLIISVVSYICSLAIYQIFFPIVFLIFVFKLLVPKDLQDKDIAEEFCFKNRLISLFPYVVAFIVYTVMLKLIFFIWPPTLKYSGASFGKILKNTIDIQYWIEIFTNIKIYIISDNPFNSGVINMMLWLLLIAIVASYLLKNIISKNISGKRIVHIVGSSMVLIIMGLFICLGFSLLRPGEISSRSLTSFGIYQGILILLTYKLVNVNGKSINKRIVLIVIMVVIILFGNMGRIGRSALDMYRLNTLERSLVTRIVSRLEMNEKFLPNAKLIITGTPKIGQLSKTTFGDYNVPSLQQFSKVSMINEISGYSFQMPNNDDIEKANPILEKMESWPSSRSIEYIDGTFIIKLQ